jgi:protein-disulfide isomerase
MPLPGHEHAMTAASAAVCAEAQGKEVEMKRLLFTRAFVDDFANKHAKDLQLDLPEFETCMDSATTAQRIEADRKILREAGFRGLPTTFVGHQRILGWRVYPEMKEAYETALLGDTPFHLSPVAYWLGVVAAVAGLSWAGRTRGNGVAAS